MEPVTHFLTGACIGRAGLNRKTAYATLVATLAAEAPDLDALWGLGGPVVALKHHRGITHTFLGAPMVAGVVVGAVWLFLRGRKLWRERKGAVPQAGAKPSVAVHWGWLYLTALIAALSHLWLDWTNNYGLRPFYPFNPRWYEGSFVFIVEPLLWALLLIALIAPWLLGLINDEIGVRRKSFRGRGWAIFALTGMILLWGWRWAEHEQALAMVKNLQIASAPVKRIALEPYPVNPFRWHAILETAAFYQMAEVDTRTGTVTSDAGQNVLYKPAVTAATETAKRTPLGQAYLDWGSWAVVRDLGPVAVPGMEPPQVTANRRWTTVEFTDLRFAYSYLGREGTPQSAPMRARLYVVDGQYDAGEALNGHEQR
jgi:inner membrane protein